MLVDPYARHPEDVVERLLAVQAQDERGARLAIRARSTGLRASDVDNVLTEKRSLVRTWLNRGTLHLVRREDYWWLHALTTPPLLTGGLRRLSQLGVSPDAADRGVVAIERALAADGPLTRAALRDHVAAANVPTEGQALVHVLALASRRGLVVRGPMVGRDQAYVLVRDWLGSAPPVDRDVALGELVRRYLAGHGPASDRDLARWAGLPLRDIRRGISLASSALVTRSDGLLDLRRRRLSAGVPPPRLLGAFEPVLLGWESREPVLGEVADRVVSGGLFRPFVMVDGHAAGTWTIRGSGVTLNPFRSLDPDHTAPLDEDVIDVVRFLGLERP